jgi:peptidoglycan/LPS O-acetylase OafA/YrhL
MNYRAEIDGLRAIAVLAVIINHLPGEYFSSGFLGVDVFFVISGFVVTASLSGAKMSHFPGFYSRFLARRIKRLWPALLVCVGTSSLVVLAVDPYPNASIYTGLSSLFGLANIALFYTQLDYFSASSKLNAFTHTWSLGVEEQFYVVFPLIMWFCFRGANAASRKLAYALIAISLVSVALFAFYYSRNQPAAYFLMPMRMWELGLGSLAFLVSGRVRENLLARYFSLAAPYLLLALLLCFLLPQEYAAFTTILAVVITALLLLSQAESATRRFLSTAPVVYVGKISYSLYLYHWPVVVLAPMALPEEFRIPALYVVVMFAASALSYHLVESPFRRRPWAIGNARIIVTGLASSVVMGAVIYAALANVESIRLDKYSKAYPPRTVLLPHSGLKHNPTCVVDDWERPLTPETFSLCTIRPAMESGKPTIWFEGDSHTGHLQAMMVELYETQGLGVHLIETPGRHFPASGRKKPFPSRNKIHQEILDKAKPGDVVAISRRYISRTEARKAMKDVGAWTKRLSTLARKLDKRDLKLIVIGPIPMFRFEDVRFCNSQKVNTCSIEREGMATQVDKVMDQLDRLARKHENVFVFDPFPVLCPPESRRCYSRKDGIFMYRDKEHLNVHGATLLARPFTEFLKASGAL